MFVEPNCRYRYPEHFCYPRTKITELVSHTIDRFGSYRNRLIVRWTNLMVTFCLEEFYGISLIQKFTSKQLYSLAKVRH